MPINTYIKEIKTRYATGISTEHSYRGDLQVLIREIADKVTVTNEPKRQKCGAPDYIIQRKEVPLGYIEAKDIGIDLDKVEKTDQMKRYLGSLDNLILTDYLEFRFYRYGNKVSTVKLAEIADSKVNPLSDNFDSFTTHITDFCDFKGQTIKSAEKLAKMMAQKARMMEEVLFNAVSDTEDDYNTLHDQLEAFREILIHDLDEKKFADIYAQTIAYGLFAARLHDETLEDFSRQEARELIPRSNPFLRNLFDYVSGADLDERVVWIVDDLADILRATDLQSLLKDFGTTTGQTDPFIHFYETFLAEYDSKLRKSRGVYYTPEPVVNFIVRAVDDILKDEFGLSQGLADTSKIKINVDSQITDKRYKNRIRQMDKEVHKVQILDPSTGTGTFLAEVVKQIYSKFKGQEGLWSSYVEEHLLPRLNGFEILMAPYTMCHLKIEMMLRETGYKPKDVYKQKRLRVFLTNSLEEAHPDTGTLFASWLSNEANEANAVKKETPVMCIIGNPPYSVSSSNKSEWIESLMTEYKRNLNERNINPLSDDYIKFIRFSQFFIDKNSEGIIAFISNNSFIDGLIHKQMRKSLLESFSSIYVLDLHGNSNRNEMTVSGGKDENVFDIQQGVSINIFVKHKNQKTKTAKVNHIDILGKRSEKYEYLNKSALHNISWTELSPQTPDFFFVPKDFSLKSEFDNFYSLKDIYMNSNVGINTEFDKVVVHDSKDRCAELISDLCELNAEDFITKHSLEEKVIPKVKRAQNDAKKNTPKIVKFNYRPFDFKYTVYTGVSNGIMGRPRNTIMKHLINDDNIALISMRQFAYSVPDYCYTFISDSIVDNRLFISNKGYCSVFPIYIENDNFEKSSNLNPQFIEKFELKTNLKYNFQPNENPKSFSDIDFFNYEYAILHSTMYRKKYLEFLKIDFPRIPQPKDEENFWKLAELGSQLRNIHLLESPKVNDFITSFPKEGTNIVDKPQFKDSKVYINKEQYFDGVPEIAWNFYIGGYQPAQKWLKDRKGRELSFDDIFHYQKIIVALTETDRLMKEIDKVVEF
ncbi:MAG: N-6 DNA methylase [Spirochaetales bacterium]|uniref:site-specific DNA-methyltransferase (adenine-specific) n=1 Tax=Candidatus Thalassospirochaeta sargassi TaxID=3119039 RepID=A0AAJ1II53_9SPIO|nr:N-6 DNA methylase [Spirochaetales bacterium]